MKEFNIKITEILEKQVSITANSYEEALKIAEDNYKNANDDYILSTEDFQSVQFS